MNYESYRVIDFGVCLQSQPFIIIGSDEVQRISRKGMDVSSCRRPRFRVSTSEIPPFRLETDIRYRWPRKSRVHRVPYQLLSQFPPPTMFAFQILLLWLCSVIIVAAPTADSTIPAVHQHDKRAAECYPPTRFETLDTVDINPIDCGLAIRDMPTTMKLGDGDMFAPLGGFGNTVHDGSPFRLPRHFASGSYMIGVTMAPGVWAKPTVQAGTKSLSKLLVSSLYVRLCPNHTGAGGTTCQASISRSISMFSSMPTISTFWYRSTTS